MKKLTTILMLLVVSLSVNAQVKVLDRIVPNSVIDTYPTHTDSLGRGGLMAVDTWQKRNSIPTPRRKAGMLVRVKSLTVDSTYTLGVGLTNSEWTPFISGGAAITNLSQIPNRSYNDLQDKPEPVDISGKANRNLNNVINIPVGSQTTDSTLVISATGVKKVAPLRDVINFKEDKSNKVEDLSTASNVQYPTVLAVVNGLSGKANTVGNNFFSGGSNLFFDDVEFTNNVLLNLIPTLPSHATRKSYVDNLVASSVGDKANITGANFTGDISAPRIKVLDSGTGEYWESYIEPNGSFKIDGGVDGTTKLMIGYLGDVGIGTTSPTAKLDVAGDANVSGTLMVGGTLLKGNVDTQPEIQLPYSSGKLALSNEVEEGRYKAPRVVTTIDGNDTYFVTNEDYFMYARVFTANKIIELPDLNTVPDGRMYIIKRRIPDGAYTMTLKGFGTQIIDDANTKAIAAGQSIRVIKIYDRWLII